MLYPPELRGRVKKISDLAYSALPVHHETYPLPEKRERHQMELGLQMALGVPLAAARGLSHPEYEQTYMRARAGVPDRRVA